MGRFILLCALYCCLSPIASGSEISVDGMALFQRQVNVGIASGKKASLRDMVEEAEKDDQVVEDIADAREIQGSEDSAEAIVKSKVIQSPAKTLAERLSSLRGKTVNVDIGTLGVTFPFDKPDLPLITFDPFDAELIQNNVARLPFLVLGMSQGNHSSAIFNVNNDVPGCSSANEFDYNTQLPDSWADSWLKLCYQPKNKTTHNIPAIQLSTLLSEAGVQGIDFLKIDAQGSDSDILRDVIEHTKIPIRKVQIECQDYIKAASILLYPGIDNDCGKTKKYMQSKFPGLRHSSSLNDAIIFEYNDVYENLNGV